MRCGIRRIRALIDVLAPITPEVFPGMGHNVPEQRIA